MYMEKIYPEILNPEHGFTDKAYFSMDYIIF